MFFEGFDLATFETGEAAIRVRHGGAGPPILLLHGHPRTHATWHRVAPLLASEHTVVCPDLRGYGGSSKPPTTADHAPYSKRAMAGDCMAVMRALGHERFAVAGHDRGCYVAFRLAMDHPEAVSHLAALDGVPIGEALARCGVRFASRWWHWFFLEQTAKPAEPIINADPETWYGYGPEAMGADAYDDYLRAIRDPATVHAMCEDYRAGLGIDREHDDEDRRAGRRLACPLLMVWAAEDDMEDLYGDPLEVWRAWAGDVRGRALACGHHMAEEAPEELASELRTFVAG
jgi:haloacetate dehalogenase